jgi:hypothetical protein
LRQGEILDENVRLRDKPMQQSQVFFRLQIDRCALLAAVEPYEVRRHSLYGRIVMARGLAFREPDLDDARAGVGKANGGRGVATACSIETTSSPASEPPENLREGQTFR